MGTRGHQVRTGLTKVSCFVTLLLIQQVASYKTGRLMSQQSKHFSKQTSREVSARAKFKSNLVVFAIGTLRCLSEGCTIALAVRTSDDCLSPIVDAVLSGVPRW